MAGLDYSSRVLDSRYRVIRKLAKGGMGTVYLGEHILVGRKVAIKVLHAELGADEEMVARFYREARAAAAIGHRNIIEVLDVGATPEGDPYLVMEYLEGESLGALLQRSCRLDLATAAEILGPMLRALQAAHDAGIVHRDLKPENVFLAYPQDGPPVVKIIDFGISKVTGLGKSQLTRSGALIGTPAYMAPEQARGDSSLDHRADVYAVGVIFYELLTGKRPFRGDNHMALLAAILTTEPARPSTMADGVPPDAERIILKAMSRDPAERYGTAREMLADLEGTFARITGGGRLNDIASSVCATTHAVGDLGDPETGETSEPVAPQMLAKMVADSTPSAWSPSGVRTGTGRRHLLVPLIAVAVLAIAAGFAIWSLRGGRSAPKARAISGAALLSKDGAVLACPLFEAAGVEEPSGWFGAAAAALTCEWATVMMGGLTERTLVPAQLLDLPTELVDDFPDDPYCEKGARERSQKAARSRATAWLDGRVELRRNDFEVRLRVMTPDGRSLGSSSGAGRALYQAIRAALDGLVRSGAMLLTNEQDPRAARWSCGIRDTALALAMRAYWDAIDSMVGIEEALAALEARSADLGLIWSIVKWQASKVLGKPPGAPDIPTLDKSTPEKYALSALAVSDLDPGADKGGMADDLADLRMKERDPLGRATLGSAEIALRFQLVQVEKARAVALSILQHDPRGQGWGFALAASAGQRGSAPAARGWAAWSPYVGEAWTGMSAVDQMPSPAVLLEWARRGALLAPGSVLAATDYGRKLVKSGQPERARSWAARLSFGGAEQQAASDAILSAIECSQARFEAAMVRARDGLLHLDSFCDMRRADHHLRWFAINTADILGRTEEVADAFARRFVLGEPVRLSAGRYTLMMSAAVCAQASREVGTQCFAKLNELNANGWFSEGKETGTDILLGASEHFLRKDFRHAADALRPLLANGFDSQTQAAFIPLVFDVVGEPEVAVDIDDQWITGGYDRYFNGATLAHVREAKRAFKRKDYARARELAQTVIDSWSTADAPVPAVAEMRTLLARLPK